MKLGWSSGKSPLLLSITATGMPGSRSGRRRHRRGRGQAGAGTQGWRSALSTPPTQAARRQEPHAPCGRRTRGLRQLDHGRARARRAHARTAHQHRLGGLVQKVGHCGHGGVQLGCKGGAGKHTSGDGHTAGQSAPCRLPLQVFRPTHSVPPNCHMLSRRAHPAQTPAAAAPRARGRARRLRAAWPQSLMGWRCRRACGGSARPAVQGGNRRDRMLLLDAGRGTRARGSAAGAAINPPIHLPTRLQRGINLGQAVVGAVHRPQLGLPGWRRLAGEAGRCGVGRDGKVPASVQSAGRPAGRPAGRQAGRRAGRRAGTLSTWASTPAARRQHTQQAHTWWHVTGVKQCSSKSRSPATPRVWWMTCGGGGGAPCASKMRWSPHKQAVSAATLPVHTQSAPCCRRCATLLAPAHPRQAPGAGVRGAHDAHHRLVLCRAVVVVPAGRQLAAGFSRKPDESSLRHGRQGLLRPRRSTLTHTQLAWPPAHPRMRPPPHSAPTARPRKRW